MDMMTLASAKAYADTPIVMADYGIDIPGLVMAGGGMYQTPYDDNADAFLNYVKSKKPKYAIMEYGGEVFRSSITVLTETGSVAFALSMNVGDIMMVADVSISYVVSAGSYALKVCAVVTQTPLTEVTQ